MTKKQFVRCIAFFAVLCLLVVCLCDFFRLVNNSNYSKRFYSYQKLEKGTVDTVVVGTSGMDRYIIPSQIYEEYGATVYPLAVDAMPCWLYIDVIKEALRYQDPELFILDIRAFGQGNQSADTLDIRARRVLDSMDFFSPNRISAAFKTMNMVHQADAKQPKFNASYLFSFIKYHTMWEEKDFRFEEHIGREEHMYGGFFINSELSVLAEEQEPSVLKADKYTDLDPLSEAALHELIDFIREEELNVLFFESPRVLEGMEKGRTNRIFQILEQENMPFLHYYTNEADGRFAIPLDHKEDFYNAGHVNYYGAAKVTEALGAYLDEHYDLPDRRGEEAVQKDWEGVHQRLLERIEKMEKKKD